MAPLSVKHGRRPRLMCRLCRCTLDGLSTDSFCPECGLPVASSMDDRAADPAPRGLECARCRYSLAGLKVNGVCPECAYPIEASLPGGLLKRLERDELERVRLVLAGVGVALLAWGVFTVATEVACPQLPEMTSLVLIARGGAAVIPLVVLAFWWRLVALRRRTMSRALRRAAVASAVGLVVLVLMSAVVLVCSLWPRRAVPLIYLALASYAAGQCALAVFFVCGTRYSRAVAHDEDSEVRRHRWVAALGAAGAMLPALLCLLQVPGAMIWLIRTGVSPEAIDIVYYTVVAGGGVLVAVALLLWVRVLGRAERRVSRYVARLDAATWKKQIEGAA